MSRARFMIAASILVFLGVDVTAQSNLPLIGASSPPLPQASPILSASMDDIPPTWTKIVTADGAIVDGKPNFMLSYVDVSPLEQRVWFTLSANRVPATVYFNRRTRATTNSPWYWTYTNSVKVLEVYENNSEQEPPSFALGTVLYSAAAPFRNPVTGVRFTHVMWAIYQPTLCNGVTAGFLVLSFSNDGTTWIGPYQVLREGGPTFPCWSGHANTVPVEAVSAIFDGDFTMHLMGLEGDGTLLVNRANMDRTLAVVGFADINNPGLVRLHPGPSEVSALGVVKPNPLPSYGSRYAAYAYFVNMQMAWDAVAGELYVSRAYPYGIDRGHGGYEYPFYDVIPHPSIVYSTQGFNPYIFGGWQDVDGCVASPFALPTRVQIYKTYLGTLSNFQATTNQTWTLVADVGSSLGYKMYPTPFTSGVVQPAIDPSLGMVNVGRDLGSGSFVTDGHGVLKRYGTTTFWLGGSDIRSDRTTGTATCRLTGNERVLLYTLTP